MFFPKCARRIHKSESHPRHKEKFNRLPHKKILFRQNSDFKKAGIDNKHKHENSKYLHIRSLHTPKFHQKFLLNNSFVQK